MNRKSGLLLATVAAGAWWAWDRAQAAVTANMVPAPTPAQRQALRALRHPQEGAGADAGAWPLGDPANLGSQGYGAQGYDFTGGGWTGAGTDYTAAPDAGMVSSGDGHHGRARPFDAIDFLAANPDLLQQIGPDPDAATQYYVAKGKAEGRKTHFDAFLYLASNPDLLDVMGPDPQAATIDYVTRGFWEGRPTSSFDPIAYGATQQPQLGDEYGQDIYAKPAALVLYYVTQGRQAELARMYDQPAVTMAPY
jgi:hypothetical protein